MRTVILAAAAVAAALAQPARVQKIVQLKHVPPMVMRDVLSVFGCGIRSNDMLKTVQLECANEVMPAVEEAIKRFDVPPAGPTSIELTAYFLVASETPEGAAVPVPADLDPVVKQIRAIFAFKNFSLLDTLLLRSSGGDGAEISGQLDSSTAAKLTRFSFNRWSVRDGDKGQVIVLERLRAGLRNPVWQGTNVTYIDTGVNLEKVEVPAAQNVVIGKSSLAGPNKALIIVLRARVP
jgi:hypothetical protein